MEIQTIGFWTGKQLNNKNGHYCSLQLLSTAHIWRQILYRILFYGYVSCSQYTTHLRRCRSYYSFLSSSVYYLNYCILLLSYEIDRKYTINFVSIPYEMWNASKLVLKKVPEYYALSKIHFRLCLRTIAEIQNKQYIAVAFLYHIATDLHCMFSFSGYSTYCKLSWWLGYFVRNALEKRQKYKNLNTVGNG